MIRFLVNVIFFVLFLPALAGWAVANVEPITGAVVWLFVLLFGSVKTLKDLGG